MAATSLEASSSQVDAELLDSIAPLARRNEERAHLAVLEALGDVPLSPLVAPVADDLLATGVETVRVEVLRWCARRPTRCAGPLALAHARRLRRLEDATEVEARWLGRLAARAGVRRLFESKLRRRAAFLDDWFGFLPPVARERRLLRVALAAAAATPAPRTGRWRSA